MDNSQMTSRQVVESLFGEGCEMPFDPREETCWIPRHIIDRIRFFWVDLAQMCEPTLRHDHDPRIYKAIAQAACQRAACPWLDADDYFRLARVATGGEWGRIFPEPSK